MPTKEDGRRERATKVYVYTVQGKRIAEGLVRELEIGHEKGARNWVIKEVHFRTLHKSQDTISCCVTVPVLVPFSVTRSA